MIKVREIDFGIKRIQLETTPLVGIKLLRLKSNVYLFKTELGSTIFDCGPQEALPTLEAFFKTEQINQIILTHGHADHAGNGKYWMDKGVKLLAPLNECEMIHLGGPAKAPSSFKYSGFEPTGMVNPGDVISIGQDFSFSAIAIPGHTSGSLCYFERRKNILIAGDLFYGPFWRHSGTFLLEVITSIQQTKTDLKTQINSLNKISDDGIITASTLILPGHGPAFYLRDNPDAFKRSLNILRICTYCFHL